MGVSGKWFRALIGLKRSEKSYATGLDENKVEALESLDMGESILLRLIGTYLRMSSVILMMLLYPLKMLAFQFLMVLARLLAHIKCRMQLKVN